MTPSEHIVTAPPSRGVVRLRIAGVILFICLIAALTALLALSSALLISASSGVPRLFGSYYAFNDNALLPEHELYSLIKITPCGEYLTRDVVSFKSNRLVRTGRYLKTSADGTAAIVIMDDDGSDVCIVPYPLILGKTEKSYPVLGSCLYAVSENFAPIAIVSAAGIAFTSASIIRDIAKRRNRQFIDTK